MTTTEIITTKNVIRRKHRRVRVKDGQEYSEEYNSEVSDSNLRENGPLQSKNNQSIPTTVQIMEDVMSFDGPKEEIRVEEENTSILPKT